MLKKHKSPLSKFASEMGKAGMAKRWKGKTKKERAEIMAKVRAGKTKVRLSPTA